MAHLRVLEASVTHSHPGCLITKFLNQCGVPQASLTLTYYFIWVAAPSCIKVCLAESSVCQTDSLSNGAYRKAEDLIGIHITEKRVF